MVMLSEQARRAIFDYIEVFYNCQRLHSYLRYMSPAAFEAKYQEASLS
jgi:transposase InsO family protein